MPVLMPIWYSLSEKELKALNSKINIGFPLEKENFYDIYKDEKDFITAFEYYDEKTNKIYENFVFINWKYESVDRKLIKDLNLSKESLNDYICSFSINWENWFPREGKHYFGKWINRKSKEFILKNWKYKFIK